MKREQVALDECGGASLQDLRDGYIDAQIPAILQHLGWWPDNLARRIRCGEFGADIYCKRELAQYL